jgi:amino-acid N-acetyltransferase
VAPRLQVTPLAVFERDGIKAALRKAGLPGEDVDDGGALFWRFETYEDVPVGFGGLEIHGKDALLRSVVTLPPLRRVGYGGAIVAALESEAQGRGCQAVYLLTADAKYFVKRGYAICEHKDLPKAIRSTAQFASPRPEAASAMVKRLG